MKKIIELLSGAMVLVHFTSLFEYQHYALYDMLIKSWCETNPSAFSVDDIGDITIIDGKRPE